MILIENSNKFNNLDKTMRSQTINKKLNNTRQVEEFKKRKSNCKEL